MRNSNHSPFVNKPSVSHQPRTSVLVHLRRSLLRAKMKALTWSAATRWTRRSAASCGTAATCTHTSVPAAALLLSAPEPAFSAAACALHRGRKSSEIANLRTYRRSQHLADD